MELVQEIYTLTEQYPKHELYALAIQMRRAAVSIPSNISEGYKRRTLGEYVRFLCIADASAAELDTQVRIGKKLYPNVKHEQAEKLLDEVQRMFGSLIPKLKQNNAN